MVKHSCSTFRVITANFQVSKLLGFLQYFLLAVDSQIIKVNENKNIPSVCFQFVSKITFDTIFLVRG